MGGWPLRLQESLRATTSTSYLEVVNHAFRFTLSTDILEFLPGDIERFKRPKDRVSAKHGQLFGIFQFASDSGFQKGTNQEYIAPKQFKENIRTIGAYCLKQLSGPPLLVTMPPLIDTLVNVNQTNGYNHAGRAEYNQYCRDVAKEEGYLLADAEQAFLHAMEGQDPANFFFTDGFHPNPLGHILIKDTVLPVAAQMLKDYP